jgi:hypothetical protein
MFNAKIAEAWLNFLRMRSQEIVLNVQHQFPMTRKILVVRYGAHLPPLIRETFAQNSNVRRIDSIGAIDFSGFDYDL